VTARWLTTVPPKQKPTAPSCAVVLSGRDFSQFAAATKSARIFAAVQRAEKLQTLLVVAGIIHPPTSAHRGERHIAGERHPAAPHLRHTD